MRQRNPEKHGKAALPASLLHGNYKRRSGFTLNSIWKSFYTVTLMCYFKQPVNLFSSWCFPINALSEKRAFIIVMELWMPWLSIVECLKRQHIIRTIHVYGLFLEWLTVWKVEIWICGKWCMKAKLHCLMIVNIILTGRCVSKRFSVDSLTHFLCCPLDYEMLSCRKKQRTVKKVFILFKSSPKHWKKVCCFLENTCETILTLKDKQWQSSLFRRFRAWEAF